MSRFMTLCYPPVTWRRRIIPKFPRHTGGRRNVTAASSLSGAGAVVPDQQETWTRPRAEAWGNEPGRAVLRAVAEDVARRSGHRVAAIEALRSDGNLEFVAIAGSPEAE